MSSKQTEQEHMPMVVSDNSNQIEGGNSAPVLSITRTTTTTTTALVETNRTRDLTTIQTNRDNWSNRVVYLLSIIGFVVDLGKFY